MSEPLLGTGGASSCTEAAEVAAFDAAVTKVRCAGYYLKNTHATLGLLVRVCGMHIDRTTAGGTDGRALLAAGEERLFVSESGDITKITVQAASAGTVTFKGYVQKAA